MEKRMKYALPILNDKLSPHFGCCSHFAFYDVDDEAKTIQKREVVASPGHQPGVLPEWLSQHGVSTIIVNGIGSRAQTIFNEKQIKVVTSAAIENPEQILQDYLNGTLTTTDNFCDH